MNKTVTLFFLLQACCLGAFSQDWSKISDKVASCQRKLARFKSQKSFIETYNEVRKENHLFEKLNVHSNDTIYILEETDIQSLSLFSTIWTQTDTLSYLSHFHYSEKYDVKLERDRNHSKRMMDLASQWDIEEIRKEEHTHQILPFEDQFLSRIIIHGEEFKVDCVVFKDFYALDHD